MAELKNIRINYNTNSLDKVESCPFEQFENWLEDAFDTDGIIEPNAMTLSTVSIENKPSARIVLLRGFSENGFEFYTNYQSRKGTDLEQNNNASLCFYWDKLERQIRIEGKISKLSELQSDQYFNSRPRGSRISAIISNQSEEIISKEELKIKFAELDSGDNNLERPQNWGGYILSPNKIEFWQGRPSRLHDRFLYELDEDEWEIKRLCP